MANEVEASASVGALFLFRRLDRLFLLSASSAALMGRSSGFGRCSLRYNLSE